MSFTVRCGLQTLSWSDLAGKRLQRRGPGGGNSNGESFAFAATYLSFYARTLTCAWRLQFLRFTFRQGASEEHSVVATEATPCAPTP